MHAKITSRCRLQNGASLEKVDVIIPESVGLDVQPHLVESKVVGLRHLLLVGGQRGLGLLHVEQVRLPQLDRQHPEQARQFLKNIN